MACAASYAAYRLWAAEPNLLHALIEPILNEWREQGTIPDWAGPAALGAVLFHEYRADHFAAGYPEGESRMRAVMRALHMNNDGHKGLAR